MRLPEPSVLRLRPRLRAPHARGTPFLALVTSILAGTSLPGPDVHAQTPEHAIETVVWMAGCWARTDASGETVERWTLPEARSMFGWSRLVRDGALRSYEMLAMRVVGGRLAYVAHVPRQPPTVFPATAVSDTLVVFENPEHDFPTEIRYRRVHADSIVASIAGGEGTERSEIPMPYGRVRCSALPPG